MSDVDAVVLWNNDKAYFFRGSQYVRYDVATDRADDGYPQAIASGWPGVFSDGVDAVVLWNNDKAYFFRGAEYVRYDVATDRADDGYPQAIASGWPGVFSDGVDAVVLWNNDKAYFFRGSQYVRYDVATDQVDQEPRAIADGWPGVFTDGVDAVVLWNNDKAYFFRGAEYIRYDVATDRADDGYPQAIANGWAGLGASAGPGPGPSKGATGARDQVLVHARSMMAEPRIAAKRLDADGTRVGWEKLEQIFEVAAPAYLELPGFREQTLKRNASVGQAGIPHWCGIFALWALKSAGVDVGEWKIGSGISSVRNVRPVSASAIKPGDIAYIDQPFQHHAIVTAAGGGSVETIDGNTSPDSTIAEKQARPVTSFDAFYTAFGEGA